MKEQMQLTQRIDEIFESLKFAKMNKSRFETFIEQQTDPYIILLAYYILSKSNEAQAYPAILKVLQYAENPAGMTEVEEEALAETLAPISESDMLAKQIISISKAIKENFEGKVPNTKDNLLKITEIDDNTADLTVAKCFDKTKIYVDEKIQRVFNRIGIIKTNTPKETEVQLSRIIPAKYHSDINTKMQLLAKTFCAKEKPLCPFCPLNYYCDFSD
ncbi:MAG: hypothetical protein K6C94_05195 [Candidatus Gastranaerophilales bacterium]|nr:hypothetical protein [Candidatus Gastranaerophilales bacterium]